MDADKLTKVSVRGQKELKRESKINEAEFIKLFSKKIEVNLDTRGFRSIDALSKYLDKNKIEIPKTTIDKYQGNNPSAPSIYNASAISKALEFSLDELRDSYFKFEIANEETVSGKLFEYYQLYCSIISTFPNLSNFDLYKDIPCFVEFLNKVDGLNDKKLIGEIALDFEERYFIRNSVIISKNEFLEELRSNFVKRLLHGYIPNDGRDKKEKIEEYFAELVEKYLDMNELNKQVNEFKVPINESKIDSGTLKLLEDYLKNIDVESILSESEF